VDELAPSLRAAGLSVIYLNHGLNTDSHNHSKPAHFEGIEDFPVDTHTLHPVLAECRVIKSEEELRVLQYVNDISSDAHLEVSGDKDTGQIAYEVKNVESDGIIGS